MIALILMREISSNFKPHFVNKSSQNALKIASTSLADPDGL